jgi:iron(III) transport system substrate-binding protein
LWVVAAAAARINPALSKAKQEAEARGYVFAVTHDEVVAEAKKEGKIRVLTGLESDNIKPMADAFKKKYPFIDFHVEEISGTESYQRFVLELKAGRKTGWDCTFIAIDFYNDYVPFIKKFDILGMAGQGVLGINTQMVDPFNRNIVSPTSIVQSVAYNKKAVPAGRVPDKWVDFLKPEFKGKKFMADFRPYAIAALVPAWGLEKTLDFSRKLAAQQPQWVRGATRPMTAVVSGESLLFFGPNSSSVKRAQAKDPTGTLGLKIVEPVPVRLVSRADGILRDAEHPHAALLWLEFQASPEGQKIIDEFAPYQASVFTRGSVTEQEVRGKELSAVDWNHFTKTQEYQAKITEALGFPKAEMK